MTEANCGTTNNDTSPTVQEPSQAVQELQVCRPPADHLDLPWPCYLCPCYLCNSVHVTYVVLFGCIPLQCPSCIVQQFCLYQSRTLQALSTGDETAKLTSTWSCSIGASSIQSISAGYALTRKTLCAPHQHDKFVKKLLHHYFTLSTYQLRCQHLCIVHRIQNLPKILARFWGVRLPQLCLFKKSATIGQFMFESVLKHELLNINSQFSSILLVFLGHDMKIVSFLSLYNQFILHLRASFHTKGLWNLTFLPSKWDHLQSQSWSNIERLSCL